MERLKFITAEGVCGLIAEWVASDASITAAKWVELFGTRIGSGSAPIPNNGGFVDMSQFAVVIDASGDPNPDLDMEMEFKKAVSS